MLLHLMPKPTIAMVGGPAVGAGCGLAAACDLRFASDDAVFAASFSPNGLSGDYGGSFFWTRIGGTALARRLYLLNEKIPADQAHYFGMVHAVRPVRRISGTTPTRSPVNSCTLRPPCWRSSRRTSTRPRTRPKRRRWLFAHEAENQGKSTRAMMERLAKKDGS